MDTGTQKKLCQLLGKINERLESRSDPKAREVRKKIGVLRAWLENAHSADSTAQSLPSAKEVPSFGEILLSRPVLEADNAFIKLEMPPDQTDETNIIASSFVTSTILEFFEAIYDPENHSPTNPSSSRDRRPIEASPQLRPFFCQFITGCFRIREALQSKSFTKCSSEAWYPAKLFSNGHTTFDKTTHLVLPGVLELGANQSIEIEECPLIVTSQSAERPLQVEGKLRDFISDYGNVSKDSGSTPLSKEIKSTLCNGDVTFTSCFIFNVGHGNCAMFQRWNKEGTSEGRNAEGAWDDAILLDIGYSYGHRVRANTKSRAYSAYIQQAKSFNPDLAILTHWHADHVFGHIFLDSKVLEKPWIAPQIENHHNVNIYALYFATHLTLLGSLTLIDTTDRTIPHIEVPIGIDSTLAIWQGIDSGASAKQEPNTNPMNREGLILETRIKAKFDQFEDHHHHSVESLFLGDAPYSSLPVTLRNALGKCRYLLVPHHGRKTNTSVLTGHTPSPKAPIAIISNSKYANNQSDIIKDGFSKHRHNGIDDEHLAALADNGYIIAMPSYASTGIRIRLNRNSVIEFC